MDVSRQADSFELADYLGVLRRRWWIIVGLTCLGIAASVAYIVVAPKVYSATAAVEVSSNGQQSQQAAGAAKTAVNMDNEAQLVQSASVAEVAVKLLHSTLTPAALSRQVAVVVPPNSQLLQITCSASSAAGSAACANAFATAFLQSSSNIALSGINSQLKLLNSQTAALLTQITTLNTKISNLPSNDPTRAGDQALVTEDVAKLHSFATQIATLEGQQGTSSAGYIATTATLPAAPTSPRKVLVLPSGTTAGLLLGLVFAMVADRRDRRIHGDRDVERLLDLPVLLGLQQREARPTLALASPRSRTGQAISELAHFLTATLGEGNHVVLVAGTSLGPSASVVAVNLASALARMHSDAMLVCADLRGTIAPQLLGLGEGRGLAEVLNGTATVSEVTRRPADLPRLRVITPGLDSTVTLYDLQHHAILRLADELRTDTRYVIVEAQARGQSSDSFALAQFADAALVVVDVRRTIKADAVACVQRLDRLHTPVLGALVLPPLGRRRPAPRARQNQSERSSGKGQPVNRRHSALPPLSESRPQLTPGKPDKPELLVARADQRAAAQAPRNAAETWPFTRVVSPSDQEKGADQNPGARSPEGYRKSAKPANGS